MANNFKRICLIVLDSLGLGALPDAADYGDEGADTFRHTYHALKGLKLPTLARLGLLDLAGISEHPLYPSYFALMHEASQGKDTTTGHWEMMGLVTKEAFDTFWNGFPPDVMGPWSQVAQCGYLGNKPASGTEIIQELGEEHVKTRKPIVYTSADSVFQIAAHETHFGLSRLYDLCAMTRELLNDSRYSVGRVIARPFTGEVGSFRRTKNRKDYALSPAQPTVLDQLKASGLAVVGIGKIPSLFNYSGITKDYEAHNDEEVLTALKQAFQSETSPGFIFANFNDLDMLYGHRRNVEAYGRQLEWIDRGIAELMPLISRDDLLMIAADHGNDPSFSGTDHTREFTPWLLYSPQLGDGPRLTRHLPTRKSFSDIGQTICENFSLPRMKQGQSLFDEMVIP